MQRRLWVRIATFLVWLLAAACAVFWALRFTASPQAPLSAALATPASTSAVDPQSLAKGLGGGQTPAKAGDSAEAASSNAALQAARFALTGVVVQKAGAGQGVALIAIDGKPPRPYRVGATLADGVVLRSVSNGKALLASSMDAAPSLTLALPQLTTAVVGTAFAARPAFAPPIISPAPIRADAAKPAANPNDAPEQRPARSLASRRTEAPTAPTEEPKPQ
jgi:general secretion pathway protein C